MMKLHSLVFCLMLFVTTGTPLAAQHAGAHNASSSSAVSEDARLAANDEAEEQALSASPQTQVGAALVVRLSDALDPSARAAALAVIETVPGVSVGENATHEIGPRPSIEEVIALYEIPGAIPRTAFSRLRSTRGITSIEELFELYSAASDHQQATISNIPPPIELGDVASDGFAERLRTALLSVARRAAQVKFALGERKDTISVCLSNRPSRGGTCPLPRSGRPWNEMIDSEPIYLSIEVMPPTVPTIDENREIGDGYTDADMRYFSVVAIGRDGEVTPLAAGEGVKIITKRINIGDDQGSSAIAAVQFRFAPEEPLNGKLPRGFYDLLVITAREPIPPGLWLDKADPRSPRDACPPAPWFDICRTMNFGVETIPFSLVDVATVEVAVVPENKPTLRVVNGVRASRNLSLWQAQLLRFPAGTVGRGGRLLSFKDLHRCGGAYLGDGFVLTAAHCIPLEFEEMRVRLGSASLVAGGATFKVAKVVVHNDGQSETRRVDLALIQLDDPKRRLEALGANVRPVALATDPRRQFLELNLLTATGWGFIKARLPGARGWDAADGTRNSFPNVLQQARLSQLDISRCTAIEQYRSYRPQDMLCLIGTMRNTDTCQGDSGGPVTGLEGRERRLVGIVSTGVGCAQDGVPAVYVNVAQHRDWIDRAKQRILTSDKRGVFVVK
jgi:hypothetical protein